MYSSWSRGFGACATVSDGQISGPGRKFSQGIDNRWKPDFDKDPNFGRPSECFIRRKNSDLNNIETVFTTFELGQTIRKLPGSRTRDSKQP